MSAKDQILAKPIKKAKPVALPTPLPKPQVESPVGQTIDNPNVENTHLSDEARNVEKNQGAMSDVGVQSPTYDPNVVKVDRPTSEESFMKNASLYHEWLENGGLTEEERKKRDKSRAIRSILAAVGDGVSAIANLHGTTKYAPNMQLTSSLKSLQDRWDKEDKEGKEEAQKRLSLYQQMEAAKRAEDAMRYRKERDKVADERYAAEVEYRKQKDKEDRAARAEAARVQAEQWQKTFDQKKKEHEDKMVHALAIKTAQANSAKGVRGDRLGFSDGNKNKVSIYENVWKPSMQQVYNAIIEDGAYEMTLDEKIDGVKPTNIESIVKQNWTKSPKARAIMYALSKIDPATMTSEVEDGIVDYTPSGGGNGQTVDYVPKKEAKPATNIVDYVPPRAGGGGKVSNIQSDTTTPITPVRFSPQGQKNVRANNLSGKTILGKKIE